MKRILTFILAAVMLSGAVALTARANSPFSDVAESRWSFGSVVYAVENGYMNGTGGGKFSPSGTLSRAMVVTVLWRMSGSPAPAAPHGFSDVPDGLWYTDAVAWARSSGVVNGTSSKTFSPNGAITREQLATMLKRYAGFRKYDTEETADLSVFPDASAVSSYAAEALGWAVLHGLVKGKDDGRLDPGGPATREQFAAILERFDSVRESFGYVVEYNHPVIQSSYTEKEYPLVDDADFYVSPDGDDSADGSFDHPFATFARAAEAIRAVPKTAEKGGVTAAFFAGYYAHPGFELTEEDTGTAECPVTYCAYGDGDVVFTGGVRVSPDEFVPLEESDRAFITDKAFAKVKKAKLSPAAGELSYSSEAFTRSAGRLDSGRYPNRSKAGDTVYLGRIAQAYENTLGKMYIAPLVKRFSKYHTFEGVEIVGCIGHEYWHTVFPVTGFDPETGVVSYKVVGPQYGLDEYAERVYLINISEEVDQKGEYWIDPDGGTLYVYEPENEDYIVSAVESFGTITDANYITFRGLEFEGCTGDGFNIAAHDVTFDRSTIFGIGGRAGIRCTGVGFRMQDCVFAYTAGCGMWFDSGKDVEDLVPTGPYIDNCLIHDMGQKWMNLQNPGIRLKCAVGASVSHCELYNTPCAAISYGYVAEGGRERAIDCVFEYNYIHDVDREVVDIGCIYTGRSFVNRDNVFRYNLISDIPGSGGRFAIYLDDGMAAQKIYGNIFYSFADTAIMHSGGQYMDIHDNVFISDKNGWDGDPLGAVVAWDKYYNFAFDDEDEFPTPWNSGNFRILYSTLGMRPAPGSEYYGLWHDRWPELYEIIDDYDWPNFTDVTNPVNGVENPNCPATPGFCSIYNNYAIGFCENRVGDAVEKFAIRCENNPHVPLGENPLFVNPALGDYRTVDGAPIAEIPFELIGRY